MASEKAIEAAARTMFELDPAFKDTAGKQRVTWDDVPCNEVDPRKYWLTKARAALAAAAAVDGDEQWNAALRDVAAERRRQVEREGWTPEHDDEHNSNELAIAAACYALPDYERKAIVSIQQSLLNRLWPWSWDWWKPHDRRRDLIRAGALIIAEIERLDRALKRLT